MTCLYYSCNNQLYFSVVPPKMGMPPISESAELTQTAIFTCSATGYNVSYHWTTGSGSFPSNANGINTNTLRITSVRSSNDDTYTCVASNEGGIISSHPARLTVTGMTKNNAIRW